MTVIFKHSIPLSEGGHCTDYFEQVFSGTRQTTRRTLGPLPLGLGLEHWESFPTSEAALVCPEQRLDSIADLLAGIALRVLGEAA